MIRLGISSVLAAFAQTKQSHRKADSRVHDWTSISSQLDQARRKQQLENAKIAVQEAFNGKQKILTSLDGRLALGALMLNGFGLLSSLSNINDQRENIRKAAWFMLVDASTGVLGAIASMSVLVIQAKLALEVGQHAVGRSVTIHALRAAGHLFTVLSSVANAGLNWMRGKDALTDEEFSVGYLYFFSTGGLSGHRSHLVFCSVVPLQIEWLQKV